MIIIILLTVKDVRLTQQGVQITDEENFSDETDQTFNQVSSLRTLAWRRCRLYRLSTEVWRWPLADGFNMDDPAYGVSVADLSQKAACPCDGPPPLETNQFLSSVHATKLPRRAERWGKPPVTSSMTQ